MFAAMAERLRQGEIVVVHGFGSFRIRQRRSRTGRNPRTGTAVSVPPKSIVYFRTSAKLLNSLNPCEEGQPDEDD
jgi:integration host factor subunit beta